MIIRAHELKHGDRFIKQGATHKVVAISRGMIIGRKTSQARLTLMSAKSREWVEVAPPIVPIIKDRELCRKIACKEFRVAAGYCKKHYNEIYNRRK